MKGNFRESQVYALFYWLINWPTFLLSYSSAHTDGIINTLALFLGNFIAYSLLTYLFLWLRGRTRLPKLS
jgi:hypothetical protein